MALSVNLIKDGGEFQNENGIWFHFNFDKSEHPIYPEYSSNEELGMFAKCNSIIYVNDPMEKSGVSTRHAIVKKSVVYILTSDYNKEAYFQKMKIKNYKEFHNG